MSDRDTKPENGVQVLRFAGPLRRDTLEIMDYRRLAPALAAHEAEWISSGKLRECIAAWLQGADFSDPAMRPWEKPDQLTAKEELLGLLRECERHLKLSHGDDELLARIRKRLEAERL